MNRRKFLRNTSVAGIGLSTIVTTSCNREWQKATEKKNTPAVPGSPDQFVLLEATVDQLQEKMQKGEYSSREITRLYLDRIAAIDREGPALHSVIETNPDALAIADRMDAERKSGRIRGPLHGIPVLIKDNIDTGDRMMTTAGSMALAGFTARKDAFIIEKLRQAGAVILGKTNLSEWANFRSNRSSSGWSSRGGQTKNPYVLDRNPSGSSSGSAVAVSANLCALAVGTETDGSVISPSSHCGIVGIKPTVGLLSRSGIIPISKTQDTAGPMARTVKDAAILLSVMTGIDPSDPVTKESEGHIHANYTRFLVSDALKGKRIGIEKKFLTGHEAVVGLYKHAIDDLKKAGAEIVEVELMKMTRENGSAEFDLLQYEFKEGLNAYFAKAGTSVRSLEDLIRFNAENKEKVMPYFGQEILEKSQAKGSLDDKNYLAALAKTTGCRKIIDDLLATNKLDAIAGTSTGIPGCIDLVNGDYDTGFYFCPPAAMAGYPHITVPMGNVHGLPAGLSFMAGAYQEGPLIGIAYGYEQATRKRQAPAFRAVV